MDSAWAEGPARASYNIIMFSLRLLQPFQVGSQPSGCHEQHVRLRQCTAFHADHGAVACAVPRGPCFFFRMFSDVFSQCLWRSMSSCGQKSLKL